MIRALSLPLLCTFPLLAAAPPQEPEAVATLVDSAALELDGTLIPSASEAVTFWPETWAGELLFLEVVPHGAMVEAGQVIAVFDPRQIDEQLRAAKEDLESSRLSFRISTRKAELEDRAGRQRIEMAERALKRAEQGLESFHEFELPMRAKQMELQQLYSEDGIKDLKDELAQLKAMYEDDEITDATEDIVLQRSVRQLERTLVSAELSKAQRQHQREFDWRMEAQRKEEDVLRQRSALEKMVEEFKLDQRARHDRQAKTEGELKRKAEKLERLARDRQSFELEAPRAGMLLHGKVEDYYPGAAAPRHPPGGPRHQRAPMFTIAEPRGFHVAVKLNESQVGGLQQGAAVTIEPVIQAEGTLRGTLTVEVLPLPESARGPENQYAGLVESDNQATGWAPGMRAKVVVEG